MDLLTVLSNLNEVEFLSAWMVAFLPLPWIVRRLIKPVAQKQHPFISTADHGAGCRADA